MTVTLHKWFLPKVLYDTDIVKYQSRDWCYAPASFSCHVHIPLCCSMQRVLSASCKQQWFPFHNSCSPVPSYSPCSLVPMNFRSQCVWLFSCLHKCPHTIGYLKEHAHSTYHLSKRFLTFSELQKCILIVLQGSN